MKKHTSRNEVRQEKIQPVTLEEIILAGAVERVKMTLIQERGDYLKAQGHLKQEDGKNAIVSNGFGEERSVQTPLGPVSTAVPRTRNRIGTLSEDGTLENFKSTILPSYSRKSLTIEETIPLLYLYGLSTNDFVPALKKMFGEKAIGISASSITRMLESWKDEMEAWKKRDFSEKEYCYVWVDGIYFGARNSTEDLCVLVMIGATKEGKKELIMIESGYRESTESWLSLLRRMKTQNLKAPKLFIGDGALGFWSAARQVFPGVKEQRCWVHKTANVLDKLPKSQQKQAKTMIQDIYMASTRKEALLNYDRFISVYKDKYPKAVICLEKDKDRLFAFYDFPAAHWIHIRTTNPIESTFATARLRSKKTRGNWSAEKTEMMVFKLLEKASKGWKKLNKHKEVEKVMLGVKYEDGLAIAA